MANISVLEAITQSATASKEYTDSKITSAINNVEADVLKVDNKVKTVSDKTDAIDENVSALSDDIVILSDEVNNLADNCIYSYAVTETTEYSSALADSIQKIDAEGQKIIDSLPDNYVDFNNKVDKFNMLLTNLVSIFTELKDAINNSDISEASSLIDSAINSINSIE